MKERNESQKGPRRSEWLFGYTVGTILNSAKQKLKYHEDRIQVWSKEREEAVEKIKAAGLEVREYNVTGGKDVQVVVDPTHQNRLNHCSMKIREHQNKAKEYKQWVAVLETQNPMEHIDLHMEDALYFGVAREQTIDE